jgi:hypothetical protein
MPQVGSGRISGPAQRLRPKVPSRSSSHAAGTRRRLGGAKRAAQWRLSGSPFVLPPSPLLRLLSDTLPLHHPSRPKGRRTAGYFCYRHRPLLRRHCHHDSSWPAQRSTVASCFSWTRNDSPTRLLLRLCCTAPALCFLAKPKHGRIMISGLPRCCCSLPHQAKRAAWLWFYCFIR